MRNLDARRPHIVNAACNMRKAIVGGLVAGGVALASAQTHGDGSVRVATR